MDEKAENIGSASSEGTNNLGLAQINKRNRGLLTLLAYAALIVLQEFQDGTFGCSIQLRFGLIQRLRDRKRSSLALCFSHPSMNSKQPHPTLFIFSVYFKTSLMEGVRIGPLCFLLHAALHISPSALLLRYAIHRQPDSPPFPANPGAVASLEGCIFPDSQTFLPFHLIKL